MYARRVVGLKGSEPQDALLVTQTLCWDVKTRPQEVTYSSILLKG